MTKPSASPPRPVLILCRTGASRSSTCSSDDRRGAGIPNPKHQIPNKLKAQSRRLKTRRTPLLFLSFLLWSFLLVSDLVLGIWDFPVRTPGDGRVTAKAPPAPLRPQRLP